MMKQHVYILRSVDNPDKLYVGYTQDIDRRLQEHNSGSQIDDPEMFQREIGRGHMHGSRLSGGAKL